MKFPSLNEFGFKKNDFILAAVFLSAAILCTVIYGWKQGNGSLVRVTVDGELLGTYSLQDRKTLTLHPHEEESNILVIQDGACFLSNANCPDRLCVRQGKIRKDGQTIVCMPHRLVIEITGGEDSGIDSLAQ